MVKQKIKIELDNDVFYTKQQYDELISVIKDLKKQQSLTSSRLKKHNKIGKRTLNIKGKKITSQRDLSIDTIKTSVYFTKENYYLLKQISMRNKNKKGKPLSVSMIINMLITLTFFNSKK